MTAKVLIVEDEMLVAADLEASLEELGFQPIGVAADRESALRLVQKRPDVALVDVNLLDGPTGPEIGRQLARDYNVSVVFVTANPGQVLPGPPETLGVMSKPCDPVSVGLLIAYALGCRRGQPVPPPRGLLTFH